MRTGGPILALLLFITSIGGCASANANNAKNGKAANHSRPPVSATEIQARAPEVQQAVIIFVDAFISALVEACDVTERNIPDAKIRSSIQERKIGGALAGMKNAVHANPYVGLLDTVVMVTLMADATATPEAQKYYGESTDLRPMREMLATQKEKAWEMAARFVTEDQLQELRQSIKDWQAEHTGRQFVSFVRLSDLPEAKDVDTKKRGSRLPNSVFGLLFLDPLSNLDPAVREVALSRQFAERVFYYMQRMPMVLAWQTDQLCTEELAAPEVQRVLANTASIASSSAKFSDATDRFATSIERFRADWPEFRTKTVEQAEQALGRQREGAMRDAEAAVSRQRDAAIRQASTQIAAERDAAVKQFGQTVQVQQRELSGSMREILDRGIDRIFLRSVELLGLTVAAIILLRVVFVFSRQRPQAAAASAVGTSAGLNRIHVTAGGDGS